MPTIWDLLPAAPTGQVFLPVMQDGDQRDPKSAVPSDITAPPTQTRPLTFWDLLPATPYAQPFVPMMLPKDPFDPWGSPAIRPAAVALGAQAPFPGVDRATNNPGFVGLALGQSASSDSGPVAPMVGPADSPGGTADAGGSTRTPHGGLFTPALSTPDKLNLNPSPTATPTDSRLTPAQQEAFDRERVVERAMLPSPPTFAERIGWAGGLPQSWWMNAIDAVDPQLAADIRSGLLREQFIEPPRMLGRNILNAASESARRANNGAYETMHGNAFTGPANMALGTLGFVGSPLMGLAKTLGDVAAQWTGNPDFGRKVEFAAPLLVPAAGTARLGSSGSRFSAVSEAAKSVDLARKAELTDGAAPASAAGTTRIAPPALPDAARRGTATAPIPPAAPAPGAVDYVASPPLGWSDIDDFRARHGVPTRHTIAVGRVDVPGLEDLKLEGASPLVRDEARLPRAVPGEVRSPSKLDRDRNHAEEDWANQFDRSVRRRRMIPSDLEGTVTMRLSQSPCSVCRWGLNSDAPPGVLKQLSSRYPRLDFVIETEAESGEVSSFEIKNGSYIGRSK